MDSDFIELAEWIYKVYQVKPINIIYDVFKGYKSELRPRLEVVFEFNNEKTLFLDEQSNFDEKKQSSIKKKFEEILIEKSLIKKKNVFNLFDKRNIIKYDTDHLLVIFSAFAPIARQEANEAIPVDSIKALKQEINNPDLWEISPGFEYVTFFFYTDKQKEINSENGVKEMLASKYYDVLKKYDEFEYFKRIDFFVFLDSKENFDSNYESNWYYYYK